MYLGIFSGVGKAIEGGWDTFVDGFNNIISILENLFKGVNQAIPYINDMVDYLKEIILTMPTWIRSIALLSITISVIYFFINREQGS